MTRCPTLHTPRLTLRPFTEADLPAYTAIMTSAPVRKALYSPDTLDHYGCWEQLAAFRGQWELRGTGQWAVEERASGRLVGRAGTHWPHRHDWPGMEVGWAFDPDVWGRGYATEAGAAAVDWAFSTHDITELNSMIHTENPSSMAVAQRLGFHLGETRVFAWFTALPHGRWVLTRDRWNQLGGEPHEHHDHHG